MCDILCGDYSAAGSRVILARRLLTTPANGLADLWLNVMRKKHAAFHEVENRRAITRGEARRRTVGKRGGAMEARGRDAWECASLPTFLSHTDCSKRRRPVNT